MFKNRPIRNKNCLWRPCLLMDWDEMIIIYRGPSIDAPYQVSVHLAEGFQEKIKMWKANRRRTPSDGKSSHKKYNFCGLFKYMFHSVLLQIAKRTWIWNPLIVDRIVFLFVC
jgi:hypothetical protein